MIYQIINNFKYNKEMEALSGENLQHKFKSKINKKDLLNQSILSKLNAFISPQKDSSSSNNYRLVSGYSSIGNQITELSTFIGNPNNLNIEKPLKKTSKISINLQNKLNQNNIDYLFINKTKAFDYLEELDNLSDSEYQISKLKKIPKLDFTEIFQNYKNTHVKVKIVKGLSTSSLSSESSYSSSISSQRKNKRNKKIKKKKQSIKKQEIFNEQGGILCNVNYDRKKNEDACAIYSKIFESMFEED